MTFRHDEFLCTFGADFRLTTTAGPMTGPTGSTLNQPRRPGDDKLPVRVCVCVCVRARVCVCVCVCVCACVSFLNTLRADPRLRNPVLFEGRVAVKQRSRVLTECSTLLFRTPPILAFKRPRQYCCACGHYYGKADNYTLKLCYFPTVFLGGTKICELRGDAD